MVPEYKGDRVISYNKQATLSSTYRDANSWVASRAVDGNADTLPYTCNCCAASLKEDDPWLYVDFKSTYSVTRIVIYGRTDGQFGGQSFAGSTIHIDKHLVDTIPVYTEWINFWNSTVMPALEASDVNFTLTGSDRLIVVCEIIVYGDCIHGSFGESCQHRCHCEGGPCPTDTGVCLSGTCAAGYKGVTCSKECDAGYFGQDCAKECHCEGYPCLIDTGICPSGTCVPGYKGVTCTAECDDGFFGQGCARQCYCLGNSCQKDTGVCPSGVCEAGYKGQTCSQVCDDGYYGDCGTRCGNCKGPDICNKQTGECLQGCETGYTNSLCTTECEAGRYGFNCDHSCGMCKDDGVCDIHTGDCPNGCSEGHTGDQCLQKEVNVQEEPASDTRIDVPVFAGALVATFVVGVAVGLAIVLLVLRKRKYKETKSSRTREEIPTQLSTISDGYEALNFDNDPRPRHT